WVPSSAWPLSHAIRARPSSSAEFSAPTCRSSISTETPTRSACSFAAMNRSLGGTRQLVEEVVDGREVGGCLDAVPEVDGQAEIAAPQGVARLAVFGECLFELR